MSERFTPGPWEVGGNKGGGDKNTIYCDDATGSAIATVLFKPIDITGRSAEQRAANARLIAAAPDLFEAAADAEDAIASLTARLADCEPGVSAQEAYDSFYTGNLNDALVALRTALSKARGETEAISQDRAESEKLAHKDCGGN
jgi:hypothetical protein